MSLLLIKGILGCRVYHMQKVHVYSVQLIFQIRCWVCIMHVFGCTGVSISVYTGWQNRRVCAECYWLLIWLQKMSLLALCRRL